MSEIFSIIFGCLAIGIALSAPMGPIGILCVQRTLNNGRKSGMYTGVGAAISDLFYCLLAGFGLSIVTDFIKEESDLLQIIGCVALIIYSLFMIIRNPVNTIKDTEKSINPIRDLITGFFFTLSNPLILFLVLSLFASFSFPMPHYSWFQILLGYLFIVVGAIIWWALITYIVNKVRTKFSVKSMKHINVMMGSILLIISLYGIASASGIID